MSKSLNNINYEIPVAYADILAYNSQYTPVKTSDTQLVMFYKKYLLEKLFSVYKFNMPKEWDSDFFRYCLFCRGYVGIINSTSFGVIPVFGTAGGPLNVFYRPTQLTIANPALKPEENKSYQIYKDCGFIKLQPNWCGVDDLVTLYADEMAMITQAFGINIVNSHLAYVFAAKNKAAAEAFKKLSDKINSGETAVVYDKSLNNEDGSQAWGAFTQNLKENFIVPELIDALTSVENKFCTAVGIPNANTDKRERLITDEVNANNQDTMALCEVWLETLKEGIEKSKALFPDLELSVELRHPLKTVDNTEMKGEGNNG